MCFLCIFLTFFRGDIVLLNDTKCICHVLIVIEVHGTSGDKNIVSFKKTPFFQQVAYSAEPGTFQKVKSLPPVSNLIKSLPTNAVYYTILALLCICSWDMACSKDVRGLQGNSSTHNCSHCYSPANQNLVPSNLGKVT